MAPGTHKEEFSMSAHKRPRFRLSPTLLAMLASGILLSGCDLWSGSEEEPANNARVTSTEEPVVVAQMEEASSANGSYLFGTSGRTEDGASQFLHIVDPDTGLDMEGYPVFVDADSGQIAAQAFTMASNGLSQQGGNNVALFVVRDHRVYKVDLLKPLAPTQLPLRVSSEEHVCQLLKVIPKDGNATSSWVLLRATRDASGDCADSEQIITKVVSSDADDHTPATNTDQISQVLTVQRDAQGHLLAMFGLAPAQIATMTTTGSDTGNVDDVAISTKMTQKLVSMDGATGAVTELTLTPDASLTVTYFGRVAGSQTKAYMRVTNGSTVNGLRILDWSSGKPALSSSAVVNLTENDSVFVHADSTANYFVDGASLIALRSDGSSTILATWTKAAPQAGGVMTASYLVVPQMDADGNVSLQAFNKTKANSVRDIALPATGGALQIIAHNGDVLIVSQATGASATLWRVDLNASTTPTKISDNATLISATQAASETLTGEQQQAFVIWSNPASDTLLNVNSYQLSTGQSYVLRSNEPIWDLAITSPLSVTQGLLTSTTGSNDTLWLFDAGKASSLKQVPQAEPL
jgi:hypothetical protein